MKKFLSILMCTALICSSVCYAFPCSALAESGTDDPGMVTETHFFSGQLDTLFYSDDMFRGDARTVDRHLATASTDLNRMSYEPEEQMIPYLEDNGFGEIEYNDEVFGNAGMYGMGVACANKTIIDGGKKYTLVAVVPRAGTTGDEWYSLFSMSKNNTDNGNYYAMQRCSDTILSFTKDYIADKGITGDLKLWISGYSRSAGAANIAAAEIVKHPRLSLGAKVKAVPENIYCYLAATVRSVPKKTIEADIAKGYDFDCIHNTFDDRDLVLYIPSEGFQFERYGQTLQASDTEHKEHMLQLMKTQSESRYNRFLESSDPDDFTPYKIDMNKLLKEGNMSYVEDSGSYLGYDQKAFLEGLFDNIDKAMARNSSSGNAREGYAKTYQEPAMNLLGSLMGEDANSAYVSLSGGRSSGASIDTTKAVPLILAMYLEFVSDKIANDSNVELNEAVEKAFNSLAYIVEDSDGNLKKEYKYIAKAYNDALSQLFDVSDSYDPAEYADASLENPPEKYVLKRKAGSDKTLLSRISQRVAAKVYAKTVGDILKEYEISQEVIDDLTSDEDSSAMTYLVSQFVFGNSMQKKASIKDFSLDNQYFKHAATFMNNFGRLSSYHNEIYLIPWLRAKDPCYDEGYALPDDVQKAGYRRIYIETPSGTIVNGTVRDAEGNTVATFKDGAVTSRTDRWIGATAYDGGWWLRVPAGQDHKVEFRLSGDAAVNIKVADYSAADGKVIRTVQSDSSCDWSGLKLKSADSATLLIPAAQAADEGYDLTKSEYSLSIKRGSVSVPKAKGVKVKAASKAFSVSWTKLSASKRAMFDKIEVQYSTSKRFAKGTAKTKSVSKTKASYKVRSLKKGKKYYVRVSTVKTVKTK